MSLKKADRLLVEDAVAAELQRRDPAQKLRAADYHDILADVSDTVLGVLDDEERTEMSARDRTYVERKVAKLVRTQLAEYEAERARPTRFKRFERVVCNVGRERKWAAGAIQAVNEDDPADPTGQNKLPYVVKIDPPNGRLVSVPRDSHDVVRPEVCFGQRAGALFFTRMCRPQ